MQNDKLSRNKNHEKIIIYLKILKSYEAIKHLIFKIIIAIRAF